MDDVSASRKEYTEGCSTMDSGSGMIWAPAWRPLESFIEEYDESRTLRLLDFKYAGTWMDEVVSYKHRESGRHLNLTSRPPHAPCKWNGDGYDEITPNEALAWIQS
jgi:hypothetical protein